MFMLPYPFWFDVANFLVFPLGTFGAVMLGRGPQSVQRPVDSEPDKSTGGDR
jgi:hypothetical protein